MAIQKSKEEGRSLYCKLFGKLLLNLVTQLSSAFSSSFRHLFVCDKEVLRQQQRTINPRQWKLKRCSVPAGCRKKTSEESLTFGPKKET